MVSAGKMCFLQCFIYRVCGIAYIARKVFGNKKWHVLCNVIVITDPHSHNPQMQYYNQQNDCKYLLYSSSELNGYAFCPDDPSVVREWWLNGLKLRKTNGSEQRLG